MKARTSDFKNLISGVKETKTKITYGSVELGDEQLNSIQPHYEGAILKSTMKQLDLDSNVEIPKDTIINLQFGVKVREASGNDDGYDYINYGNYIVQEIEKQEDTNSYLIKCYDKMLYSMKDYEAFATYPITIRDYLTALCTQIGLTFKNASDTFTNYDKTLDKELYLDENGNSLNYTYRDVLDELAQATASTICINEDDDKLEIRYITNAGETTTNTSGANLSITSEDSKINKIELIGNTTQNGTPSPSNQVNVNVVTGNVTIKAEGKNLYNNVNYITNIPAGEITITNTGFQYTRSTTGGRHYSNKISVVQGKTYTFSANITANPSTDCYIVVYRGSVYGTSVVSSTTGVATFTASSTEDLYFSFIINSGLQTTTVTNIQLEVGNTKSEYEEYKSITNQINLGKNLINIQNIVKGRVDNGNVGYASNTTALTLNNSNFSFTTNANYRGVATELIKVLPNTTYYYNAINSVTVAQYIDYYDDSQTWVNRAVGFTTSYKQFTTNNNTYYIRISWQLDNSGTATIEKPQLEKGDTASSYASYFTPIELCKLGTYKDKIFKTSGKNLFDGEIELGSINPANGELADSTTRTRSTNFIKVKPNTTYRYTRQVGQNRWVVGYKADKTGITDGNANYQASALLFLDQTTLTGTFTTSSTTQYIKWYDTSSTNINEQVMLSITSAVVDYEPYGKDEWYIKKAIGKRTLNGSENWGTIGTDRYWVAFPDKRGLTSQVQCLLVSNYFKSTEYAGGSVSAGQFTEGYYTVANYNVFFNYNGSNSDLAGFKTWLSTHNTIVYYVLGTTTYTKITNTDLIEQLNSIRLLEGLNNITTDVPIDLTYVSGIDTLDEEYFNEDNVNFGEMYGPVNTIILSRSAESDEISQSIPNNLSDDEKVAIKIKENQIMNFNNRDEFLYGILTRLYGLRYTQNDYSSKGICYYNICDRYKANIFGKDYYCVMLNDDVTIESGLSENVFTELPEVAETDYSKTSTSDRIERQTTLIVDKQAGIITARVRTIEDEIDGEDIYQLTQDERYLAGKTYYVLQNGVYVVYTNYSVGDVITGDIYEVVNNGILGRIQATEIKQTNQALEIDVIDSRFNDDGSAKALKTENEPVDPTKKTTYTFDKDGIRIGKSTDDYNSLQDNTGTYYYEKGTMIGKYTKDGSVQKDLALFGKYYYGIDETLNVSTFTVADAKFVAQWYNNGSESGMGHFWNGE